jgi:ribonuclease P protein component
MERLRKRPDFLEAAKGRRWATASLVLQARRRRDDGAIRVGFTATKKIGGSVDRNRARRRLREAARRVIPERGRPGYDYVLIGRRDTLTSSFAAMLDDLVTAIDKVHRHRDTPRRQDGSAGDAPSSPALAT